MLTVELKVDLMGQTKQVVVLKRQISAKAIPTAPLEARKKVELATVRHFKRNNKRGGVAFTGANLGRSQLKQLGAENLFKALPQLVGVEQRAWRGKFAQDDAVLAGLVPFPFQLVSPNLDLAQVKGQHAVHKANGVRLSGQLESPVPVRFLNTDVIFLSQGNVVLVPGFKS